MLSRLLVALAAVAAARADFNYLAALPAALDNPRALLPRQAAGPPPAVPTDCLRAVASLAPSLPTPAPGVDAAIRAQLPPDAVCSFSTPASLSAQFASYSSELESWSSRNADRLAACAGPDLSGLPACRSGSRPTGGVNNAVVTSTTCAANAPARQTGMAAAAVAAVGFAAAVL